MISLIKKLPDNIIGFTFKGKVTAKEYEAVLFTAFDNAAKLKIQMRVLLQMKKSFTGLSLGAAKDDMQMGLKYFKNWEKIAFVSDKKWMNKMVAALGFLIPGHVKTFKTKKLEEAIQWLQE